MPDPEVPERPARRRFTAEYKLRIVEAANAATEPGAVGALLPDGVGSCEPETSAPGPTLRPFGDPVPSAAQCHRVRRPITAGSRYPAERSAAVHAESRQAAD